MAITPEKQKTLQAALQRLNIREEEVIERFVRSQGAGGQKVNKTSTAVYLKHLPTGLEVKMQQDRSQAINRFLAWRLLAEKVEAFQGGPDGKRELRDKIRKQKLRRKRKTKGKIDPLTRV